LGARPANAAKRLDPCLYLDRGHPRLFVAGAAPP
jgi:hypothetical protein